MKKKEKKESVASRIGTKTADILSYIKSRHSDVMEMLHDPNIMKAEKIITLFFIILYLVLAVVALTQGVWGPAAWYLGWAVITKPWFRMWLYVGGFAGACAHAYSLRKAQHEEEELQKDMKAIPAAVC